MVKPRLIHIVPSNIWSGRERYALDICRHFAADGWSVFAFTRNAHIIDSRFREADIPMVHAPLNSWLDVATVKTLRRFLAKDLSTPTIIHVHRYRDAFFALLAKASLRNNANIHVVTTRHFAQKGFRSPIYNWIYRGVDFHIFSSVLVKQRFLDSWRHFPVPFDIARHSAVLRSVADMTPLEAPAPEPETGPLSAIYLGRLIPGLGLETLIDAISLTKKSRIRLKIAGSGNPDYIDSLRLRAQHRGVTDLIDWRRHCKNPDQLVRESHFAVFPSLAPEAYNFNIARCMALGRPVITTAVGSQKEILSDGVDSLFIPPADAPALATAIMQLAKSGIQSNETAAQSRQRIGKEALATFHHKLRWPPFIESLTEIYTKLLHPTPENPEPQN